LWSIVPDNAKPTGVSGEASVKASIDDAASEPGKTLMISTGLLIHGSEFSEEFSCIYFPQQYFTAGYRLELHADHPAHDKKDIIAFVLIVDDPLVTGCSTPGTLMAS
jgi:hypothetical protein